jgi:hypothetical protein
MVSGKEACDRSDMFIPTGRASFDVALFGIPPRRGNDMPAQGNALGTGIPTKRMPCKGATILGCRDVAVAREKPHSVSPFQGRDVVAWRGPRALPWADM